MMTTADERLEAIFRSVFDLPPSADVSACDKASTEGWDSMAHVNLMVAIEEEFGLSMDASDSLDITSFDSARRFLNAHNVNTTNQLP